MSLREEKEIVSGYSEMINLVVERYPIEVGLPLALLLTEECKKVVSILRGWDEDLYTEYEYGKAYKYKNGVRYEAY